MPAVFQCARIAFPGEPPASGLFVIKLNPGALWVHLDCVPLLKTIDSSDLISLIDLIS